MFGRPAFLAIALGGAVGGALDIVFAIVFYGMRGVPALRILQSVASGLLGKGAYSGGAATAVLGLTLHFAIAFVAAAVFWFASRRLPVLLRHAVLVGLAYGVIVYFVMNGVVLPLSAYPHPLVYPPVVLIAGLAAHMLLFGLPIALAARYCARARPGA